MNERIEKLAEQAELTKGVWAVPDFILQRFAELIVRECLNNMENCDGDLDFAIWKTKKDFGVEE